MRPKAVELALGIICTGPTLLGQFLGILVLQLAIQRNELPLRAVANLSY